MQSMNPEQLGKWLMVVGLVIAAVGGAVWGLSRFGVRLPGDLDFGGKNWRVFLPIASCVLISVVLTLFLWLISNFRK